MVSALDNFPILRQLNSADISSLKVSCTIVLAAFLLAAAAYQFLGVNTALPHFSSAKSQLEVRLIPAFFLIFMALQLSIYYVFSRALDADMRLFNKKYPLHTCLQSWSIPIWPNMFIALGIYAFCAVIGHFVDFERFGLEPHLRFLDILSEGSAMISIWFLIMPAISVLTSTSFLGFLKQANNLSCVATDVPIKLHGLEEYQLLANALVRLASGGFIVMSFSIACVMYIDAGQSNKVAMLAAVLIVLLPLLFAFGHPIWIIRCRVQEKKAEAIEQIFNEIDDLNLAIDSDRNRNRHAYLMTQQMFVESRWEWPIASHLQKLILFGFLPPLTWVLAAVIENSVY
jgi:hypothetical protein